MQAQRRTLLGLILLLAAHSACGPAPDQIAAVTPSAPRTPSLSITPTPAFEGRVLDLSLRTAGQPGDWQVIGLLQNGSDFAVGDIQLLVSLEGPGGDTLAETTVLTALRHLAPGEVTPFEAKFQAVGAVTGAQAQVLIAQREAVERAELLVSEPEVLPAEDGSALLMGQISNPGRQPIAIERLAYLGVDESAELMALALQLHAPSWLEAGASSPFLARTTADPEQLRWIAFGDALQAAGPLQEAVSLQGSPALQHTSQGRLFAVGDLVNTSGQSREASVLLIVRHGEQVLSLSSLSAPFPIEPGERLPFGQSEFPGLSLRLAGIDLAELTLEVRVDPRASGPSQDQRLPLEVRIDSLESVGSAVFLRGSVANTQSVSLARPSLYAALRTTADELLTAGWRELAARLSAGERLDFVLDLPFPAGGDLSMAEFDVLAFGLSP